MRLRKAKRQYGCEINIAPLIDVVFLLIIFFLTVSHIIKVQVEAVTLPESTEGEKSEQLTGARVIINVHKDERIVVAGEICERNSLEQILRTEMGRSGGDGLSVLLRADREVLWARTSEIMQICRRLGINDVTIAVIEPDEVVPGP
jgi:biopolymer transport protein ExbD